MLRFLIRRLLLMIPLILGITFISFCAMSLVPGNFLTGLKLNPHISFAGTSFEVPTQLRAWETSEPRIAGVSAFRADGRKPGPSAVSRRKDSFIADCKAG